MTHLRYTTPHPRRPHPQPTSPVGLLPSRFARHLLRFACLLALCLLAAGCGNQNTFVLATATGPKTFNPLFALDGSSDAIVRLLNGALVNMDMTTHEPKPGLAESWSV